MVRREAYEAVGGYSVDKKLLRVEDYHLWIKMYAKGFKGYNIGKALYQMRDDRNAYSRRKFRYRLNEAYVRLLVVKELKLPFYGAIYALRPIIVGLLPKKLYDILHKRNLSK
jgi:glycosyltransferase EpsE